MDFGFSIHSQKSAIRNFKTLHDEVSEIRKSLNLEGNKIRLLGVSVSNLESDECSDRQLYLFD